MDRHADKYAELAGYNKAVAESALVSLQVAADTLRELSDELAQVRSESRWKALAAADLALFWISRGHAALEDGPCAVARPVTAADMAVERRS